MGDEDDLDATRTPDVPSTPLRLLGRTIKPKHVIDGREDDVLGRLAAEIVADEIEGVDAEALERDVERLFTLVEGLRRRERNGEITRVELLRIAGDLSGATKNVLGLRKLFASASLDIAEMCAREPDLLRVEDLDAVRERVKRTRETFGEVGMDADRFFDAMPSCLLAEASDFDVVAARAVALKKLMPDADVAKICRAKPWVCLDAKSYAIAEYAVAATRAAMPPDCRVDLMLSDFPSLLFVDIDALLEDIKNVFGGDPAEILRRNPAISYRVRLDTFCIVARPNRGRPCLTTLTLPARPQFEKNSGIFKPLR